MPFAILFFTVYSEALEAIIRPSSLNVKVNIFDETEEKTEKLSSYQRIFRHRVPNFFWQLSLSTVLSKGSMGIV